MNDPKSSALMVVAGNQGEITLQTNSLPDVRSLLNDEQRKAAREMALKVDLSNTRAILDFGQSMQMSELAQKVADQVRVRDLRGTPVEDTMAELGLIHKKLNPARVLSPSIQQKLSMALMFKNAIKAFVEDYEKAKKPLDALKQRMQKHQGEEGIAITTHDQLGRDAYSLYDYYTTVEAAALYLIQVMIRKYQERKAAMRPDDLKEAQALADLADYIGMVDRRTFELHYARARAISIVQSTRLMRKASEELYMMFGNELLTKLPLFEIELATFITIIQSQKRLEALNAYREMEAKQGEAMSKAMNQLAVGVAQASNSSVNDIARLVTRYQAITATIEQVMQVHEEGRQARQAGEVQLNQLMGDMQKTVASYDPTKLLRAPDDVKDVPLSLESGK